MRQKNSSDRPLFGVFLLTRTMAKYYNSAMERININVEIDHSTIDWVKNINKQLCEISNQEIDFEKMPIKPHLTLMLCETDEENLAKIANLINDSRFHCELETAEFSAPVIRGNYIMLPVKNTDALLHDYEKLKTLLSGLVRLGKHAITKSNPPHITLGYTREPDKIRDFVKKIKPPRPAHLDQIVISRAGKHGVVICGEN